MKIIIDNGGTKLDWAVLGSDIVYTSKSINVFETNDIVLDQISNIFPEKIFKEKDLEIDFYTTA